MALLNASPETRVFVRRTSTSKLGIETPKSKPETRKWKPETRNPKLETRNYEEPGIAPRPLSVRLSSPVGGANPERG